MKFFKMTCVGLFAVLSGCASGSGLVGSWALDVGATDPASARQPAAKALVSTIQFTADGKYEAYTKTSSRDKGEMAEGTYAVSGDQITTTIEGRDNILEYQVKDKQLILQEDGETLVYKRQ